MATVLGRSAMAEFYDGPIHPGCFRIIRSSLADELRARLDLSERAPQSLVTLLDRLDTHAKGTTEARLYAAVEQSVAEMVRAAGGNPGDTHDPAEREEPQHYRRMQVGAGNRWRPLEHSGAKDAADRGSGRSE
jgi:hypothetical protein